MKPTPHLRMTSFTRAARCLTAAGRLLPLMLALAAIAPLAQAALPNPPGGLANNALFKKGYLDVTLYKTANGTPASQVVTNSANPTAAQIAATTAGINQAIRDAYNLTNDQVIPGGGGQILSGSLALYFPAGTYVVNDTIKAYTEFFNPSGSGFAVPRNSIAIVGSTLGLPPTIKLQPAAGDTRFNSGTNPRPVVSFKNFTEMPPLVENTALEDDDDQSRGYFQMLRGINIHCGNKPGAIGLYFRQAQNSSIEDVTIDATGAHTGIRGLPGRGWGVVNVTVVGGQYGIDTNADPNFGDTSNAGSVLAGVTLTDQTEAAFRHDGFVPTTLVGFKIRFNPASASKSPITLQPATALHACGINLIDGSIETDMNPTVAVINNANVKNFYLRNVYFKTSAVSASSNLIKSGTWATVTASGVWKSIWEYSYCTAATDTVTGYGSARASFVQINSATPIQGNADPKGIETKSTPASATPSTAFLDGLVEKHKWVRLPSVDDSDAIDVTQNGITPGKEGDTVTVSSAALQALINNNNKVFLPKGIYRLTSPGITLPANKILFGAGRNLTRIETAPAWNPTSETPVIKTAVAATATTYLGDLTIGIEVRPGTTSTQLVDSTHDFFTALHWQAGRNSMVHMGLPYRIPDGFSSINQITTTNDHSLLKITGTGGGRWYFAGCIYGGATEHPNYRILEVDGTTEPLWFYGLNLEHALGSDVFASFTNASNIRIYTVKSEFDGSGNDSRRGDSTLMRFSNVDNVGMFGLGAVRNAVLNHGVIEFVNTSTNVLAALIAPQNNVYDVGLASTYHTLRENSTGAAYPHVVSLFKRGALSESVMTHSSPDYGPP